MIVYFIILEIFMLKIIVFNLWVSKFYDETLYKQIAEIHNGFEKKNWE